MSERARLLHDSSWQGVFCVTGGGTGFLAELLGTPGASRTVLDASIPYSAASLAELLGGAPRQACSAATARALAMHGFQRARRLAASRPFGFAVTASLATDRVKRGACRAHIALQTATHSHCGECTGFSVTRERATQEQELTEAAWHAVLDALGLAGHPDSGLQSVAASPGWQALMDGSLDRLCTGNHDGAVLLPGSFNPLHDGHLRMMAYAEEQLGLPGAFELSIENVDKPVLDYFEIEARLKQFKHPVWLTRLPTFAAKAERFPRTTFVVGMDTLLRIAAPRYYGGSAERDRLLAEMLARGVKFLVFGRVIDGNFQGLGDQSLPSALLEACTGVSEAEFRMDKSSSDLRSKRQTAGPDAP